MLLRIDRKMSWNEIAEILGAEGSAATPAALRKRFERLKTKLREAARLTAKATAKCPMNMLLELTPKFFELRAQVDDLGSQRVDRGLECVESVGFRRFGCRLGRRVAG